MLEGITQDCRRELEDDVGHTTMLMPLKRVTPEHSETNVKYVDAAAAVSALCLADAIRIYGCDTPLPEATATF